MAVPLSVVSLEKDNAVSVRVRILNWPLIPSIPAPVKFNKVSLLEKLQLTFELCGSEGSHLVAPSSRVPLPSALSVSVLSFSQSCNWDEILRSMVPFLSISAPASWNFQAAFVIRSVLVALVELSFLQDNMIMEVQKVRARNFIQSIY